VKHK
jgi:ribonuclease HI